MPSAVAEAISGPNAPTTSVHVVGVQPGGMGVGAAVALSRAPTTKLVHCVKTEATGMEAMFALGAPAPATSRAGAQELAAGALVHSLAREGGRRVMSR